MRRIEYADAESQATTNNDSGSIETMIEHILDRTRKPHARNILHELEAQLTFVVKNKIITSVIYGSVAQLVRAPAF